MRALIVEPHFDDTAYSMGGMLLSDLADADVWIVTVFTGSQFAPYAAISGKAQISGLRYQEHLQFCEKLQVHHTTLAYDEAPVRGWPMESLFDHMYGQKQEETLKRKIIADLVAVNERIMPDEVFAPLGICGHIDHVIVRDCVERVFSSKIQYYEELPYAGEIPVTEYTAWIDRLTNGLQSSINTDMTTTARRIELLKLYRSQVAEKDINAVWNYISMHQGERIWSKRSVHE